MSGESMRGLVHTLACYSMMTLISMECMEVWALCIVKHLYENWRTLWHEPRSWFFQMSGESMGELVHTLACYSMMTLISMECMEVWALCIVKHLYENWRTLWHEPWSWFYLMSGESMGELVHTLACYSLMTLISMECMEVWALCIVKHLYENWRTLWHEPWSWFYLMSGESMGELVHTLACYSLMTLISMECMEVWALCIVKHLYENWRTLWHEPWSWFFLMSGESMGGGEGGGGGGWQCTHLHAIPWWHLYPWNVWKYGHYALWIIYSQPSSKCWCLLPKMWC